MATTIRPVTAPAPAATWPELAVRGLKAAPPREQSRAREPDETGFVERDGVRVFWERYGDGSPTILLMPTWSVVHSRHWKLQIPYLARHFRVVTFDGRGNGRSDRPQSTPAYADVQFAADAVAVLDATGTDRAVACGLSMGAGYAIRLAVDHPDRVSGLVLFGASVPVWDRDPDEGDAMTDGHFEDPQPDDDDWNKYNAHFWRRDWPGFAAWFAGEKIFSEAHSTKAIEDNVAWFLKTDPETIILTERAPFLRPPADWERLSPTEGHAFPFLRRIGCPVLVVHGTDDHIIGVQHGRRLAEALGAPLVEVEGGGHSTIGREPVLANLLIRDFVRGLEAAP
jgi:pimeloyl-ACP methyl ester carboxylesterase